MDHATVPESFEISRVLIEIRSMLERRYFGIDTSGGMPYGVDPKNRAIWSCFDFFISFAMAYELDVLAAF